MDNSERQTIKNPRQGANIISVITFKWLFGTFLTGYKRELEISDLYSPLDEYASRLIGNKISHLWNQELEISKKRKTTPSLLRVLLKYFGWEFMVYCLLAAFLELFVKTTQPIILVKLLRYFRGNRSMIEKEEAYYLGTGILLNMLLNILITHSTIQGLTHIGMKIGIACSSLVYRKILKLSNVAGDSQINIGQIINLLSNDVNRFKTHTLLLPFILTTPIQIVFISYLLFWEIGIASVGGIAVMLIFFPINGFFGKLISKLTLTLSHRTDDRSRLINEIINGIKVIKMYAWEKPFAYLVDKARHKELKLIRNKSTAMYVAVLFDNIIQHICLLVAVLLFLVLDETNIKADKIYFLTFCYGTLRNNMFRTIPYGIKGLAEALVCIKRLTKILLYIEIEQKSVTNEKNKSNSMVTESTSLSFNNVTAKWNVEINIKALKDVSFQLQTGSLTAVIGQVGAGKSTLFQAILQEIPDIKGKIKINGKISYASQEPWLFSSSIKQNILFGKPMDKERYEKIIEVCELKRDFQLLPYGENTLVGEKGIKLSGGQCARVNLARAVYHEADIYLLDDPLSAVDTQVGKGIFEDCIKTFLRDKTVILITHKLNYLKYVDRIILLDNGTVSVNGTYSDLLNSGINIKKLMQIESKCDEMFIDKNTAKKENKMWTLIPSKVEEEQLENRRMGSISSNIYFQYFKSAHNGCLVFSVFILTAISQISISSADYFIKYWVNVEETKKFCSADKDDLLKGRDWYIYVYGAIIVLSTIITLLRPFIFFHMCMKISTNIHSSMFDSVIKTKMAFFNANPVGRIMNRFSADMGVVDIKIPESMTEVAFCGLLVIATVIVVASINLWLLISALLIVILGYYLRLFYIKVASTLKRLEGITLSSVLNHLSDSVRGLTTIRALNAQQLLMNECNNYQDLHSSASFMSFSGSRAFGLYIDCLCLLFSGVVIYTLLLIEDSISAGDVGLAITQCLSMTRIAQYGIRQSTELENEMISLERILEYSKLEQEPLLEKTPENKAPEKWPQHGHILFKDVSLFYDRQIKPTLKNLNFIIQSKEMVGIVGRTGAGKSSIINALFRLTDITGEIYIDNIATSKSTLQDFRTKISIVPQEPLLFAGSLRRNLDPFEEYPDDKLWEALEDVEFKAYFQSDISLNMRVADGGTNFSVGQRQLLCLARAFIRNNKILVLDEATANVDSQTDELMQKAIRKKFMNCTIIVIAHRLNTVMDSSKILVMDAGQVVEFDHPYKLLQQKNGVFYNMVQQSGASKADHLFQVAKRNYENNYVLKTSQ